MKKVFIVLTLTLQGLRKQPFKAGEKVTEDNFPPNQVSTLVEKGFLREQTAEEIAEDEKALKAAEPEVKKTKPGAGDAKGGADETKK